MLLLLIITNYSLDTDSLALAMIDDMENLVKPDKMDEWPEAQAQWFVQDPNDAKDLRYPGKMKLEWSTKCGAIIWYDFVL